MVVDQASWISVELTDIEQSVLNGMVACIEHTTQNKCQLAGLQSSRENAKYVIEGTYKRNYYYAELPHKRQYMIRNSDLVINLSISEDHIYLCNILVAEKSKGLGSHVLAMLKMISLTTDLPIRLHAEPFLLHQKLKGYRSGTKNGAQVYKPYEDAFTRHTDKLIKFYTKNGFTRVVNDNGSIEFEFDVTKTLDLQ